MSITDIRVVSPILARHPSAISLNRIQAISSLINQAVAEAGESNVIKVTLPNNGRVTPHDMDCLADLYRQAGWRSFTYHAVIDGIDVVLKRGVGE